MKVLQFEKMECPICYIMKDQCEFCNNEREVLYAFGGSGRQQVEEARMKFRVEKYQKKREEYLNELYEKRPDLFFKFFPNKNVIP